MAESERVIKGPPLPVVAGVIWAGEQLVVQRRGRGHGAGMLEFPGGKLEPGEQPRQALARELREEWGPEATQLRIGSVLGVTRHTYPAPGPDVLLIFFEVHAPREDAWRRALRPEEGAVIVVLDPHALREEDFLEADRPMASSLGEGR